MRVDVVAVILALLSAGASPACATTTGESEGIRIDVPVRLSEARVVFNLDHLAFYGDQPIGLEFMNVMVERFRSGPVTLANADLLPDIKVNSARQPPSDRAHPAGVRRDSSVEAVHDVIR